MSRSRSWEHSRQDPSVWFAPVQVCSRQSTRICNESQPSFAGGTIQKPFMWQQQQQHLPAKNRVQCKTIDMHNSSSSWGSHQTRDRRSNVHGKIRSRVVWAMACLSLHELDWSWCKSAVGICQARSGLAELRDPHLKSCWHQNGGRQAVQPRCASGLQAWRSFNSQSLRLRPLTVSFFLS